MNDDDNNDNVNDSTNGKIADNNDNVNDSTNGKIDEIDKEK